MRLFFLFSIFVLKLGYVEGAGQQPQGPSNPGVITGPAIQPGEKVYVDERGEVNKVGNGTRIK